MVETLELQTKQLELKTKNYADQSECTSLNNIHSYTLIDTNRDLSIFHYASVMSFSCSLSPGRTRIRHEERV